MLISCDDCEPIKKIGNWQIEFTLDNRFIKEKNYPDWFGCQKIRFDLEIQESYI